MLAEVAVDFPPGAVNTDGTGLYCGDQDLFAFLIDPIGWTDIDDQGVRARPLRLELRGWEAIRRRLDVLVPGRASCLF
ncbi:hypothetical protein [Singulisphaera acidiphila]|uniref:Uncharacterized protein n=1 Tax=Singulisphaera acidiphila (strain ATCC BAA-1392 / DSM 18658 / VKM B-2454 / MOB10) TaxID=886293 RepID=L0DFN1_SINAD|nr:hypothetical protein [Singulisphaera acidiphila]AGA27461.1 hypothetical protein Sinac_3188 [Singulisphaera acidiphila DSM 18658]